MTEKNNQNDGNDIEELEYKKGDVKKSKGKEAKK